MPPAISASPGPAAQPVAGGGVRRDRRQRAPSGRPLRRRSTPAPMPPARRSTSPRRCPTCRRCARPICRCARWPYAGSAEIDLMPWLLLAALLLALADTAIGLQLRGLLIRPARAAPRRRGGPAAGCCCRRREPAPRRQSDEAIIAATSETRLAYVVTGLAEVDEISQAGLRGPEPGAQPAHRGRGRRAARGRSRGRRPQPVPAALLADPERPSAARLGRRRAARRLSPPGRHDPVRHRRCRAR